MAQGDSEHPDRALAPTKPELPDRPAEHLYTHATPIEQEEEQVSRWMRAALGAALWAGERLMDEFIGVPLPLTIVIWGAAMAAVLWSFWPARARTLRTMILVVWSWGVVSWAVYETGKMFRGETYQAGRPQMVATNISGSSIGEREEGEKVAISPEVKFENLGESPALDVVATTVAALRSNPSKRMSSRYPVVNPIPKGIKKTLRIGEISVSCGSSECKDTLLIFISFQYSGGDPVRSYPPDEYWYSNELGTDVLSDAKEADRERFAPFVAEELERLEAQATP